MLGPACDGRLLAEVNPEGAYVGPRYRVFVRVRETVDELLAFG